MMNPQTHLNPLPSSSLAEHIRALRRCLIQMLCCLSACFFIFMPWHKEIYQIISQPLLAKLPDNSQMIATGVTTTFMAPLQLILFVSLVISLPALLYCLWRFICPALHQIEQKLILPVLMSAIGLFYVGVSVAYFLVLPTALGFFMAISPENVLPMTDIQSYLQFCLTLFMVFGVIFEIPIVIFICLITKLIAVDTLIQHRRGVIVGCFFVSMFITPPDAISMIMLAIPMYLLFELGLAMGRLYLKHQSSTLKDAVSTV